MKAILDKCKYIDWKSLLLSNYKSLDMSEDEVMVILMIDYCLSKEVTVITPDVLALKMNYDQTFIDNCLSGLFNKNLVTLEENENGKLQTTLNGLKYILVSNFLYEEKKINNERNEDNEKNIFDIFEAQFGRPLTYIEMETMNNWFIEGIEDDKILLALKEAQRARKNSIRYIDKILLEWRQQAERKEEGYTTITDKWHKNIKETIETSPFDLGKKDENK